MRVAGGGYGDMGGIPPVPLVLPKSITTLTAAPPRPLEKLRESETAGLALQ